MAVFSYYVIIFIVLSCLDTTFVEGKFNKVIYDFQLTFILRFLFFSIIREHVIMMITAYITFTILEGCIVYYIYENFAGTTYCPFYNQHQNDKLIDVYGDSILNSDRNSEYYLQCQEFFDVIRWVAIGSFIIGIGCSLLYYLFFKLKEETAEEDNKKVDPVEAASLTQDKTLSPNLNNTAMTDVMSNYSGMNVNGDTYCRTKGWISKTQTVVEPPNRGLPNETLQNELLVSPNDAPDLNTLVGSTYRSRDFHSMSRGNRSKKQRRDSFREVKEFKKQNSVNSSQKIRDNRIVGLQDLEPASGPIPKLNGTEPTTKKIKEFTQPGQYAKISYYDTNTRLLNNQGGTENRSRTPIMETQFQGPTPVVKYSKPVVTGQLNSGDILRRDLLTAPTYNYQESENKLTDPEIHPNDISRNVNYSPQNMKDRSKNLFEGQSSSPYYRTSPNHLQPARNSQPVQLKPNNVPNMQHRSSINNPTTVKTHSHQRELLDDQAIMTPKDVSPIRFFGADMASKPMSSKPPSGPQPFNKNNVKISKSSGQLLNTENNSSHQNVNPTARHLRSKSNANSRSQSRPGSKPGSRFGSRENILNDSLAVHPPQMVTAVNYSHSRDNSDLKVETNTTERGRGFRVTGVPRNNK